MNDVIVIGSNYATTLGTVRAVGMTGCGVRLLSTTRECAEMIGESRYITQCIVCSDDFPSAYQTLEALRGADQHIPIIPTNDAATMLLDEHADELCDHYSFPNVHATQGELIKWMDKMRQKQLAQACGLAVSEGKAYSADEEGTQQAVLEATFPCVTKAIASADCIGSKELFRICKNEHDLKEIMQMAREKHCSSVLVEQLLSIEKEYATYGLAWNGKVVMPACVDTWRSGHGAHKGVTAEGVMLRSDFLGEDKEKLENFVRQCGLNGLFCIDVIRGNGKNYFVEMNLRYGASGYAATMGGANLPGMLAKVMLHGGELDETVCMLCEPQFLSEKVDLDDYRVGFMTWREYKVHQRGEKVRFMKCIDDPKPGKQFCRLERRKHLARLLRGKKRRY